MNFCKLIRSTNIDTLHIHSSFKDKQFPSNKEDTTARNKRRHYYRSHSKRCKLFYLEKYNEDQSRNHSVGKPSKMGECGGGWGGRYQLVTQALINGHHQRKHWRELPTIELYIRKSSCQRFQMNFDGMMKGGLR